MPQVFSADAQTLAQDLTFPNTGQNAVVTTNGLQPPFQTAKAKVSATLIVELDSAETAISLFLVRNPQSEALTIAEMTGGVDATLGSVVLTVAGVDAIPDQRAVSYQLQIEANSAAGNQTVQAGAYIEATLISG